MKVIILAAGIGRRLLPYTADKPKGMVSVHGVPILENIFLSLKRHRELIKEVLIVVGYKKEIIKEKFGQEFAGLKVRYIENTIYDKTNNIYSLALAADYVKNNDVLLFECDVFFEHRIVDDLLHKIKQGKENIAVVDKFQRGMEGSVVTIKDNYITGLIDFKKAKATDIFKTLNIYYFKSKFFNRVFIPMLRVYMQTHSNNYYYEIVLSAIIHLASFKIRPLNIKGRKWYEIDDYNDLERAKFLFRSESEQLSVVKKSWGGYWNYNIIDYSMICNAFFPDEGLFNDFKYNIRQLITTYPSKRAVLNKKLAHAIDQDEEHILISNGACEAIRLLMPRLKKPLVVLPTFGEYYRFFAVDHYNLREKDDFKLNLQRLRSRALKNGNKTIIIVNPNNPTSHFISLQEIEYFIRSLPEGITVILDISFIDFIDNNYEIDYKKYKNLILVKSLGKCFGVPGLRIGFLQSNQRKLLQSVDNEMPIWNINSFAEYFLDNFHKYVPAIQRSYEELRKEKKKLITGLEKLSLNDKKVVRVVGKDANFLFCRVDKSIDMRKLAEYIFEKERIIFKDCSDKISSPRYNYLRLNVQTPDRNRKLVKVLKTFFLK